MKLLLDTHVLLWALTDPSRLAPRAEAAIRDPGATVFASAVSVWELEIKRALRKLRTPDDIDEQLTAARFEELPVRVSHVLALRALPALHTDPFDRLLVAQARADGLVLVTRDRTVARYPVRTLPA